MAELPEGFEVVQETTSSLPEGFEAVPEEPDFGGRLEGLMNKRRGEVTKTFEDLDKGEIGLGSAALQVVGKGGFAAAGDIIAESIGSGLSAITPDAIKEPIKYFAAEMIGGALDTDAAKAVADEWNKLDSETQKNLESTGAIMSFVLPKVKAKLVGKKIKNVGSAIKKERLSKTLKLPDTPSNKEAEARRLFKKPQNFDEMVDVSSKIKGVSANNSPEKNIMAIGREFEIEDNKLLQSLRSRPVKVSQDLIDDTLDKHLGELVSEHSFLQGKGAIAAAFDDNIRVLTETLDRFPKTPEGVLLARRAFDNKLKASTLALKAPEEVGIARDAVSLVLRRSLNDIVSQSAKGVDVKKSLRKQSMMYGALDNLAENHKFSESSFAKVKSFIKSHPYISYGVLTGTGVGTVLSSPAILAGTAAGAVGVGTSRLFPSAVKKAGSIVEGIGSVTDKTKLPIARSAAFFGKDEEQQ